MNVISGGGEIRFFADQALEVQNLDKNFADGAVEVAAHGNPNLPGESLPFQVLAGKAATGHVLLRAELGSYSSEIKLFVSTDGIELDAPFVNRGELGNELSVTARITGDSDAIFTGGAAADGMSRLGDGQADPTFNLIHKELEVTTPNSDGSPPFARGRPVPDQVVRKSYVPP